MKKLTIRIDDYMYNRLNLASKDNKISINKIISSILKQYIDQPKEINFLNFNFFFYSASISKILFFIL